MYSNSPPRRAALQRQLDQDQQKKINSSIAAASSVIAQDTDPTVAASSSSSPFFSPNHNNNNNNNNKSSSTKFVEGEAFIISLLQNADLKYQNSKEERKKQKERDDKLKEIKEKQSMKTTDSHELSKKKLEMVVVSKKRDHQSPSSSSPVLLGATNSNNNNNNRENSKTLYLDYSPVVIKTLSNMHNQSQSAALTSHLGRSSNRVKQNIGHLLKGVFGEKRLNEFFENVEEFSDDDNDVETDEKPEKNEESTSSAAKLLDQTQKPPSTDNNNNNNNREVAGASLAFILGLGEATKEADDTKINKNLPINNEEDEEEDFLKEIENARLSLRNIGRKGQPTTSSSSHYGGSGDSTKIEKPTTNTVSPTTDDDNDVDEIGSQLSHQQQQQQTRDSKTQHHRRKRTDFKGLPDPSILLEMIVAEHTEMRQRAEANEDALFRRTVEGIADGVYNTTDAEDTDRKKKDLSSGFIEHFHSKLEWAIREVFESQRTADQVQAQYNHFILESAKRIDTLEKTIDSLRDEKVAHEETRQELERERERSMVMFDQIQQNNENIDDTDDEALMIEANNNNNKESRHLHAQTPQPSSSSSFRKKIVTIKENSAKVQLVDEDGNVVLDDDDENENQNQSFSGLMEGKQSRTFSSSTSSKLRRGRFANLPSVARKHQKQLFLGSEKLILEQQTKLQKEEERFLKRQQQQQTPTNNNNNNNNDDSVYSATTATPSATKNRNTPHHENPNVNNTNGDDMMSWDQQTLKRHREEQESHQQNDDRSHQSTSSSNNINNHNNNRKPNYAEINDQIYSLTLELAQTKDENKKLKNQLEVDLAHQQQKFDNHSRGLLAEKESLRKALDATSEELVLAQRIKGSSSDEIQALSNMLLSLRKETALVLDNLVVEKEKHLSDFLVATSPFQAPTAIFRDFVGNNNEENNNNNGDESSMVGIGMNSSSSSSSSASNILTSCSKELIKQWNNNFKAHLSKEPSDDQIGKLSPYEPTTTTHLMNIGLLTLNQIRSVASLVVENTSETTQKQRLVAKNFMQSLKEVKKAVAQRRKEDDHKITKLHQALEGAQQKLIEMMKENRTLKSSLKTSQKEIEYLEKMGGRDRKDYTNNNKGDETDDETNNNKSKNNSDNINNKDDGEEDSLLGDSPSTLAIIEEANAALLHTNATSAAPLHDENDPSNLAGRHGSGLLGLYGKGEQNNKNNNRSSRPHSSSSTASKRTAGNNNINSTTRPPSGAASTSSRKSGRSTTARNTNNIINVSGRSSSSRQQQNTGERTNNDDSNDEERSDDYETDELIETEEIACQTPMEFLNELVLDLGEEYREFDYQVLIKRRKEAAEKSDDSGRSRLNSRPSSSRLISNSAENPTNIFVETSEQQNQVTEDDLPPPPSTKIQISPDFEKVHAALEEVGLEHLYVNFKLLRLNDETMKYVDNDDLVSAGLDLIAHRRAFLTAIGSSPALARATSSKQDGRLSASSRSASPPANGDDDDEGNNNNEDWWKTKNKNSSSSPGKTISTQTDKKDISADAGAMKSKYAQTTPELNLPPSILERTANSASSNSHHDTRSAITPIASSSSTTATATAITPVGAKTTEKPTPLDPSVLLNNTANAKQQSTSVTTIDNSMKPPSTTTTTTAAVSSSPDRTNTNNTAIGKQDSIVAKQPPKPASASKLTINTNNTKSNARPTASPSSPTSKGRKGGKNNINKDDSDAFSSNLNASGDFGVAQAEYDGLQRKFENLNSTFNESMIRIKHLEAEGSQSSSKLKMTSDQLRSTTEKLIEAQKSRDMEQLAAKESQLDLENAKEKIVNMEKKLMNAEEKRMQESLRAVEDMKRVQEQLEAALHSDVVDKLKAKERLFLGGSQAMLQALKTLNNNLSCPNCMEPLREACVHVPCGHVLCRKCITEFHEEEVGCTIRLDPVTNMFSVSGVSYNAKYLAMQNNSSSNNFFSTVSSAMKNKNHNSDSTQTKQKHVVAVLPSREYLLPPPPGSGDKTTPIKGQPVILSHDDHQNTTDLFNEQGEGQQHHHNNNTNNNTRPPSSVPSTTTSPSPSSVRTRGSASFNNNNNNTKNFIHRSTHSANGNSTPLNQMKEASLHAVSTAMAATDAQNIQNLKICCAECERSGGLEGGGLGGVYNSGLKGGSTSISLTGFLTDIPPTQIVRFSMMDALVGCVEFAQKTAEQARRSVIKNMMIVEAREEGEEEDDIVADEEKMKKIEKDADKHVEELEESAKKVSVRPVLGSRVHSSALRGRLIPEANGVDLVDEEENDENGVDPKNGSTKNNTKKKGAGGKKKGNVFAEAADGWV